jgi:8-oxo-dGTP pyrophosphatase MutT (NUDIX family)
MTATKNALRGRSDTLHQVAALPVRIRDGHIEVCLITTRETHRWTVPKGWPMKGRSASTAAKIEAKEEAGITGKVGKRPVGSYLYWKRRIGHFDLVEVSVYPMLVTGGLSSWKEQTQRLVHWASPRAAAIVVDEPGLEALLMQIDELEGDALLAGKTRASTRPGGDPSPARAA